MIVDFKEALRQVMRLDRTIGFPKETDSRSRLAEALVDACSRHSVAPEAVISQCLLQSQYCPTDYDLDQTAKGIEGTPTWEQTKTAGSCASCHGTGWKIVYSLHSKEGHGEYAFVKKESITQEVYERIARHLDPKLQATFSGVRKCHCATEPQEREWTTEERLKHDERWARFCADPRNKKLAGMLS